MFDKRVIRGSNFTPNNLATTPAVRRLERSDQKDFETRDLLQWHSFLSLGGPLSFSFTSKWSAAVVNINATKLPLSFSSSPSTPIPRFEGYFSTFVSLLYTQHLSLQFEWVHHSCCFFLITTNHCNCNLNFNPRPCPITVQFDLPVGSQFCIRGPPLWPSK